MTTETTFPAAVSRIYHDEWNPSECSLVGKELSKLCKCPTMQKSSLPMPSPYPLPDSFEVFDGDPAVGAFSFGYDLLTDYMICISSEPRFFSRESFEMPLGRLTSALLEVCSKACSPTPDARYVRAREGFAVRGCGDDLNSEIYTQESIYFFNRGIVNVTNRNEIESSTMKQEIGLADLGSNELGLSFASLVLEFFPAFYRPDTYMLILIVPQYVTVIREGSQGTKSGLPLSVDSIGIRNFADSPNDNLSSEREPLAGIVVNEIVQRILSERLFVPCLLADPIAAVIRLTHRCCESLMAAVSR
jgi:hypothetical protein